VDDLSRLGLWRRPKECRRSRDSDDEPRFLGIELCDRSAVSIEFRVGDRRGEAPGSFDEK
jgi:hypothetical protein